MLTTMLLVGTKVMSICVSPPAATGAVRLDVSEWRVIYIFSFINFFLLLPLWLQDSWIVRIT